MIKYFVTKNNDDEIVRPYSDEGGFVPPSQSVEITEEQLSEYLSLKNQGLVVTLTGDIIQSYDRSLSPTNIKEEKTITIKNLLSITDKTQLLDSRLSITKQEEFASYREELRVLLSDLESGSNPADLTLPTQPTF